LQFAPDIGNHFLNTKIKQIIEGKAQIQNVTESVWMATWYEQYSRKTTH
jgi:hypothetical protein